VPRYGEIVGLELLNLLPTDGVIMSGRGGIGSFWPPETLLEA